NQGRQYGIHPVPLLRGSQTCPCFHYSSFYWPKKPQYSRTFPLQKTTKTDGLLWIYSSSRCCKQLRNLHDTADRYDPATNFPMRDLNGFSGFLPFRCCHSAKETSPP